MTGIEMEIECNTMNATAWPRFNIGDARQLFWHNENVRQHGLTFGTLK